MMMRRRDSSMPHQTWRPFPDDAIVLVYNAYGDRKISICKDLWWGYERGLGNDVSEGVIVKAKRLDRPKNQRDLRTIKRLGLSVTVAEWRKTNG